MHIRSVVGSIAQAGLCSCVLIARLVAYLAIPCDALAAGVELTVDVANPGPPISPRLYGIFFEDINFGGDGGLNAELVKNGGFEFPAPMMGWRELRTEGADSTCSIVNDAPRRAANPNYLRIETKDSGAGYGAVNEGFRGMGVRAGEGYNFSAWVRSKAGAEEELYVRLVGADKKPLAEATVEVAGSEWQEVTAVLRPTATELRASLELAATSPGVIDLDMASLCPQKTWRNRPHGLRADLVQRLADLKPAFFRFPGGCIVEGSELRYRYQWKTTIGDLADRRTLFNRWNAEFRHRLTPDYYQSFGVGFFEYFQMSEDIGAEPLPIINCGMACQFNTGELVPLEELQPYIDDALDLVEFANGPVESEWGGRRAALGHSKPFGMKLLGIGNEQWGPQYIERYKEFARVFKEKYPEIELVTSAGPQPADERFQYLWPQLRELGAAIVDEHSYANPEWFYAAATRYDGYPRTGPKVFMGEYAAQSVAIASPDNRNNLDCALSEAAFITGMERNSDVVTMSSYAPLFGHVDAWQWTPDLIWFNNLESYATPNYYVQQMHALNRGEVVLPTKFADPQAPAAPGLPRLYATSSRAGDDIIVKVVNSAVEPIEAQIHLGPTPGSPYSCEATVLTGDLKDENSIAEPDNVKPQTHAVGDVGNDFAHTFPAHSFTVLRIKPAAE